MTEINENGALVLEIPEVTQAAVEQFVADNADVFDAMPDNERFLRVSDSQLSAIFKELGDAKPASGPITVCVEGLKPVLVVDDVNEVWDFATEFLGEPRSTDDDAAVDQQPDVVADASPYTHIDRSNGAYLREADLDPRRPHISPITKSPNVEKLTEDEYKEVNGL